MPRIKFGNTWWGEQWLSALTHIDCENRLPRGVSYARNGLVKSISINGNEVAAKVQGSRPRPYSITINIPAFKKKNEQKIIDLILGNSLFLSNLMRRHLPVELHEELLKKKVRLFPNKWSDLKAKCSCPDWAVPCKHIAAVIYLIANEIDKNPFLVFGLHNFDIFKSIEKGGFNREQTEKTTIISVEDIIKTAKNKEPFKFNFKTADSLDFSIIPQLDDQILSLLSEKTLFYPQGNFKKIIEQIYNGAKTQVALLAASAPQTKFERDTEEYTHLQTLLDENLQIKRFTLASHDARYSINGTKKFETILHFLQTIPLSHAMHTSEKVIALSLWYRFSMRIIEQGAFAPQLISIAQDEYRIRWIPALFNETVKNVFEKLSEITPTDMVGLEISAPSKGKTKRKSKKSTTHYPSAREQGMILVSQFLGYIIKNAAIPQRNQPSDPILQLFFIGEPFTAREFETKEIPQTINIWLSKFFITHKDITPILKVEADNANFTVELLAENTKENFAAPIPLYSVLHEEKYRAHRADFMRDLSLLAEHFTEIGKLIRAEGREKLVFNSSEFVEVFFKALPSMKLLGIRIILPKELQEIIKPKLTVSLQKKTKTSSLKSYLSLQHLLSFDWKIALGGAFVDIGEFKKLMANARGIIKFKDQYVYIDEGEMQKLIKNLDRDTLFSSHDLLKMALTEEYNSSPISIGEETKKLIKSLLDIGKIQSPKTLIAVLREYQERGFWWLYKNARLGFGSLIADDMGLGKTLQVIALIAQLKQENGLQTPGIVIVPTTLLTNWQREIKKFAPSLKATLYHGLGRKFKKTGYDLLLTTYGTARRELELLRKEKWSFIVIDEAQNIKNSEAAQTKAIKAIQAPIKIAMTGTPVENRLSEYWSISEFLNKGYLGGIKTFIDEFAEPIEINRDRKALERFCKITSPFILRRVKTDKTIIKDLPEKNEINQYCALTKEQTALYQTTVNFIMDSVAKTEGIERRGLIFKLMTALKQICNHPAHYLKKKEANPELSGKMALLFEILQTIYENDEKILLFTQYTEMGHLLARALEKQFKSEILFLHAGTTRRGRDQIVDRFQNEPQLNVLILSLKAGGTGLNLTAATNVIHFDLWWNPAVEAQATDRAYRIGQTENVMVHRLITKDTFEEKINQMIQDKKELADLTVVKGEKWIGELSDKDLKQLFELA